MTTSLAPKMASHGEEGSSSSSPDAVTSSASEPPPPSSSPSSPLLPRILSGSVGSLATALAVTPLEVVKIRQQTATGGAHSLSPINFRGVRVEPAPRASCPGCGTLVLNNGLMECVLPVESTSVRPSSSATNNGSMPKVGGAVATLVSIFRHEGYAGLYKGLRPTLVMSVPNTVLYFTACDEITLRLRRMHAHYYARNDATTIDDARRQSYIPLLAGSSSRLLASLSTAPLEMIRTRQASVVSTIATNGHSHAAAPGLVEEFRLLLRTNGPSSFYVGLAPTLWRDVPFSAIYWLFLERFRNGLADAEGLGAWGGRYYRERGMQPPPSIEAAHAFVSGAAAGSIAAAFTTPFDVVKTRRQMVPDSEAAAMDASCDQCKSRNNIGTFGHMRRIVQQEGLPGLWKGNLTRMVKVAPACAIMISCYEFGKRVLGDML